MTQRPVAVQAALPEGKADPACRRPPGFPSVAVLGQQQPCRDALRWWAGGRWPGLARAGASSVPSAALPFLLLSCLLLPLPSGLGGYVFAALCYSAT